MLHYNTNHHLPPPTVLLTATTTNRTLVPPTATTYDPPPPTLHDTTYTTPPTHRHTLSRTATYHITSHVIPPHTHWHLPNHTPPPTHYHLPNGTPIPPTTTTNTNLHTRPIPTQSILILTVNPLFFLLYLHAFAQYSVCVVDTRTQHIDSFNNKLMLLLTICVCFISFVLIFPLLVTLFLLGFPCVFPSYL
jgi:hypothetical protein